MRVWRSTKLKKNVNVSGHHLFADRHISYGIPPFGGFSSSRFHESSCLHHWNIRDLCFLLRIPDTSMTENIIMSSPSILVEERGDWYKSTLENDQRLRSVFEPTTFRSWERTSTAELTCCPLMENWFSRISFSGWLENSREINSRAASLIICYPFF